MTMTPQDFEAQREREARRTEDERLGIPKFDALREWVDNLEEWCRGEATARATAEAKHGEAQDRIHELDEWAAEQRDAQAVLAMVEESLLDIERGILTFEEFMEEHRRTGVVA